MSSADGRPRRRGPITLTLAWLAALAAGAGLAAYAFVTGPDTPPVDDRPRLSMSLPEPPTQERAEASGPVPGDGDDTSEPEESQSSKPPAEADTADAAPASEPDADAPGAPTEPADTAADGDAAAGQAGGVAAHIPQPPTSGQDRPTDLLNGEGAADAPDTAATGTGQQTASRGEPAEPAGDTERASNLPQLPVSDPDAPAWKRYAQRMTPPQGVPKIAIIVRGLGLSSAAAETAVNQLPASVSLSFTPYARERAKAWAAEARRNGHEVLVDLPMEPANYPATDPGPQAIMTEVDARENLRRLEWLLGQVDREVGAVAQMGSAVLADRQVAEPVLQALKDRGLMFVDNGTLADSAGREIARRLGLPFAVNDRTLDGGQVSRRAIEARLVEAERLAREQGLAVVMAHPYPVSLELLVGWTEELEARGFILVPATYAAIARAGQNAAQLR
ncbi:MAG: divergent polysaccharide deacetylase family protein [Rhodovibrio sp.]|nr:divergent polysaccharide deacetylase family protein [Rhodovibrio sp.]